uniref:Uncharacterized protein n=1 Tax=Rhizophora mucronata TaxID=61149 RepID=A0A2P2IHV8_RHIMU
MFMYCNLRRRKKMKKCALLRINILHVLALLSTIGPILPK